MTSFGFRAQPRARHLFSFILSSSILVALPASAATWHVDGDSPDCTDAGPGDVVRPFCTIDTGADAAIAGDTVLVYPATYREQVTVSTSGVAGMPISYVAGGPDVLILGTQDLSDPAGWSLTTTDAWSRSFAPSSDPAQVFVDGVRLARAPDAASTTPGSFFYDAAADVLYVDIGGGNPADGHVVEAGAWTYGFRVGNGVSHVVIRGFRMSMQNHTGVRMFPGTTSILVEENAVSKTGVNGILVDGGVGPIDILDNEVSEATSVGIRVADATGVTVSGNESTRNGFHGIALAGSHFNTVSHNRSWANERPDARTANGFNISSDSDNNIILANEAWDNQDSGFQVSGGADDNAVVRNLSWRNGDHGFDTNGSTGTHYVSNTSHGNFEDGFSIEGSSTDTMVHNCISVDNGLTTEEYQLFVDATSTSGFSSDYNLFFKSVPAGRFIRHGGIRYDTLIAYVAATGHDTHSVQGDPLFADAAGGDFSIGIGPAIDAADAGVARFVAADLRGTLPVDILSVVNTGAGIPDFADLGAIEYVDQAPTAFLRISAHSAPVPFLVIADASRSTDLEGIASYTFDFGDGTVIGPQASPIAVHTYTVVNRYTMTLTVTDTAGQQDQASRNVNVRKPKKKGKP